MSLETIDRARGTLLGLAVVDAFGAPLEGLSGPQVRSAYGLVTDYVDGVKAWRRKPHRWRLPGLYTDDTQQALVLAESLVRFGRIDGAWLAATYLEMAEPPGHFLGAHRGAGKSFRLALDEMRGRNAPDPASRASAGIGAAMRIAPLGLFYAARPTDLLDAVLTASLPTHRDVRSLAGAIAVAQAVRLLAAAPERPTTSFPLRLAALVAEAETSLSGDPGRYAGLPEYGSALSASIAHVEAVVDRPREAAFAAIVEQANRAGAAPDCRRPTMGFPPALIPTCLYLLLTTDGPEEALVEIINLGGDADTAGAILGAMVGALYGESALPRRWLDGLRNRDGIALRAAALIGEETGEEPPALIATERYWTEREERERDSFLARPASGDDLGANRRRG